MSRTEISTAPVICFIVFFIILRVKIYLDDVSEFEEISAHPCCANLGILLGMSSWFLWIVSAVYLSSLPKASLFLAFALILGTIDLLISPPQARARHNRTMWIGFNVSYILLLICMHFEIFGPSATPNVILLLIGIVVALYDTTRSRSLDNIN
jgi:hypothetical protein